MGLAGGLASNGGVNAGELPPSAVTVISTSGHPTTGTWAAGQAVLDSTGASWVCTVGGTPGTWVEGAEGGPPSGAAGGDLTGTFPNPTVATVNGQSAASVVSGASDTLVDAKGDLIAGTANDTRARVAVGSDGQVLTADAASTPGVKWAAGGMANPMTTPQDLIVGGTAGAPGRLAVGTAGKQQLVVRSDGTLGYLDTPMLNVKAWGAKGDSTGIQNGTEDSTAIRAAITAMTANSVLYFPAGGYRIHSTNTDAGNSYHFTLPSNCAVVCDPNARFYWDAPPGGFVRLFAFWGSEVAAGNAGYNAITADVLLGTQSIPVAAGHESDYTDGQWVKVGSSGVFGGVLGAAPPGEICRVSIPNVTLDGTISAGAATIALRDTTELPATGSIVFATNGDVATYTGISNIGATGNLTGCTWNGGATGHSANEVATFQVQSGLVRLKTPLADSYWSNRTVTDGAITSGANILTSATATFTAADVGKIVSIAGAGVAAATLKTPILGYTNATTVTTSVNASTTVTGASTTIGDTPFITAFNPCSNSSIRGGQIYGQGVGFQQFGVSLDRAENCQVLGVRINDLEVKGVELRDAVGCEVAGNYMFNIAFGGGNGQGYGVAIEGATQDTRVHHNYISKCRHAVAHGGQQNRAGVPDRNPVDHNVVFGTTSEGLDSHASTRGVYLDSNIVRFSQQGISIAASRAKITNNTVTQCRGPGLELRPGTMKALEYDVHGLMIIDPGSNGNGAIQVFPQPVSTAAVPLCTCNWIRISDFTIRNPTTRAVYIDPTAGGGLVSGSNRFANVELDGRVVNPLDSANSEAVYLKNCDNIDVIARASGIPATRTAILATGCTKGKIDPRLLTHASLSSGIGVSVVSGTDLLISGGVVPTAGTAILLDAGTSNCTVGTNHTHGSTTGVSNLGTGNTIVGTTTAQARVVAVTQSATPAINTDITDVASITGLAQAITSMTTNLTGTPVDGDSLLVRITDNGTARAITWGASFEASTIALPTTTVISTMLAVDFIWNTVTSKWRCVGVA